MKLLESFIEGVQEKVRQELTKEMEEKMEAYKFSMQEQFQSMISHHLGSIPGLNVDQVPRLSLNFDAPRDASSAPSQPMHGRNPNHQVLAMNPRYYFVTMYFSF